MDHFMNQPQPTAPTPYKPRHESIVDLMERDLPPSRWMLDDRTNDKELVEGLKTSGLDRAGQETRRVSP